MDSSYKEVIDLIQSSNEIVVFTGAGISINNGIPDFRSSDGLYSLIEQNYEEKKCPRHMRFCSTGMLLVR